MPQRKTSRPEPEMRNLWLLLALVLGLTSLLVIWLADNSSKHSAAEKLNAELLRSLNFRQGQLEQQIATLRNDVLFLSRVPPITAITQTYTDTAQERRKTPDGYLIWKHRLEQIFGAYMEAKPELIQARLIEAASGRELVRINRSADGIKIVPDHQLQYKGDRDYVQAALGLHKGQVLISPFNLNREHGRVERPIVPTLRLVTPVFDGQGRLFGLVVINADANHVLATFARNLPRYLTGYVGNADGDFIMHPDVRRTYGFDLGLRHRWQDEFQAISHPGTDNLISHWRDPAGHVLHVASSQMILGDAQPAPRITLFMTADTSPITASVASVRRTATFSMVIIACITASFLLLYTQNVRRKAQISAEQKRLAAIVSSTSDAILSTSLHDRILSWNVAAQRMFGYSEAEAVGRLKSELIGLPELLPEQKALRDAITRGDSVHDINTTRRRQDGQVLPVSLSASPILNERGRVVAIAESIRDISAQKAAEKQIRQLNANLEGQIAERTRELEVARDRAELASQAKSAFVANISHEIRTPMNAVLGLARLLAGTPLSSKQSQYLQMLRGAGEAMLNLLNDILDFSKIEAGQLTLHAAPFRLDDILDVLATIMSVNAADKDLELIIGMDPDVPQDLVGDAMRLQQVLVNLVGNAIKFTERGEISLLVHASSSPGNDAVDISFRVRDTGIGISAEQQAQLFMPFSQGDGTITRRFGGTGLGLAISRRLVTLMGGEITLVRSDDSGSEFLVSLPLRRSPVPVDSRRARDQLGELRILVVDDNDTSREYLCKTIVNWRWQADSASSGEQARTLVRSAADNGRPYDVILVDWQMPGLDGLDTLQAIRDELIDDTPMMIIMAGASAHDHLLQQPAVGNADAILIKPVTGSSLFDTLHETLRSRTGLTNPAHHRARRDASLPRLDGAQLLLVEDNALNQFVARNMLEQAGASVEIADNGQQAVERLRSQPGRYQMVLMDVQMPVMDGYTATRLIREELRLQLPILAMSAGVMESEQVQCLAAGMDDFIVKPIDVERMLTTIHRYLPAPNDTPALAMPAPADEPAVFDIAPLAAIAENDEGYLATLAGLVRRAVNEGSSPVTQARQDWQAGRHEEAARRLHALRGGLGSLGARRFAEAALRLETAMHAGDGEQVDRLFPEVEQELMRMMTAAQAWLAGHERPAG